MKIIKTANELINIRKTISKKIGFIPTMGSLHEGHISLIKKAREENDIVIVSIFLNPTQFLEGEDLDSYPKKDQADIKICSLCKVDYLFMPSADSLYFEDETLIKAPIKSYILEGKTRPGHFDGVLRIVLKLFNITKPTNAYFGKKDAQQICLIKQMVKNLFLDINIIPCEIIRQNNGLALSSRNAYLTEKETEKALDISRSIKKAAVLIANGEDNTSIIKKNMAAILKKLDVEYIAFVNHNFNEIKKIEKNNTIILIVAKINNIRLLDNLWI